MVHLQFGGGLLLLGLDGDHRCPAVGRDLPRPLCPFGEEVERPAKALVAAADGQEGLQRLLLPLALDVGAVRLVRLGVCSGT